MGYKDSFNDYVPNPSKRIWTYSKEAIKPITKEVDWTLVAICACGKQNKRIEKYEKLSLSVKQPRHSKILPGMDHALLKGLLVSIHSRDLDNPDKKLLHATITSVCLVKDSNRRHSHIKIHAAITFALALHQCWRVTCGCNAPPTQREQGFLWPPRKNFSLTSSRLST